MVVELLFRLKQWEVSLNGEKYIAEEAWDIKQGVMKHTVYAVDEGGNMVIVKDDCVKQKVWKLVDEYEQNSVW